MALHKILVAQGGGPTAVINQSLVGVALEARKFANVERVYGAAFGVRGIRVEEPSQIGPALRDALAADETVVVDVATDINARAPEPWLPAGA